MLGPPLTVLENSEEILGKVQKHRAWLCSPPLEPLLSNTGLGCVRSPPSEPLLSAHVHGRGPGTWCYAKVINVTSFSSDKWCVGSHELGRKPDTEGVSLRTRFGTAFA